ncbi:iron dicitrate transporter FecR [Steroidobacter agaridevorans]|uniref:Iron dicitrate transporter FecR n=1 Tax=Steroidobacter agaridevorans TaxID=2695856 RepID=A0A829YB92_9GAMM|nr:FecR domain-containing protein [Steroidobacter agaridevorans]GFE79892.1 iron dicitrate transporter FecR [Steroidobacter agaridevorans]
MRARPVPADLSSAEAAARWAVRLDGDNVSDEERRAFEAWRSRSAENAVAYERALAAMHVFDVSPEDASLDALRRAALRYQSERSWLGVRAAAAALVLLVAGVGAFIVARDGGPVASLYEKGAADYVTRRGEKLDVTLPDGSALTLNTETDLDVVFDGRRRTVEVLRGQAFFNVAKDPSRPFVVVAGGKQIVAVGTAFDVRLDQGRVEVQLVEGHVVVENAEPAGSASPPTRDSTASVHLNPGEALVATDKQVVRAAAEDQERLLKWRDGLIEFDNTSLADAVAEFNRYSAQTISIDDPQIAKLPISGVFRTNSQRKFLEAVTSLHPVTIEYRGTDRFALVPR